jgi:hypothetical protein
LLTGIKTINNFLSVISDEDEESIPDFPLSDRPLCDLLQELFVYYEGFADYYLNLSNYYQSSGNPFLAYTNFCIAAGFIFLQTQVLYMLMILDC